MARVLIFGDSITWGSVDLEEGGWADRLKRYIYKSTDSEVNVYNLGIGGDNSEDLLKRIELECAVREPDAVIVAIGTNDAQYVETPDNPRMSIEKFKSNLQEILSIVRKSTPKVAFIGLIGVDESRVMPVPWAPTKYYTNARLKEYNEAVKRLCEKEKLPFVDLWGLVSVEHLSDGLHPDTEGHRTIFEKVKEDLAEFLPDKE